MPDKVYGLYLSRNNSRYRRFTKSISFSERGIKEYLFNRLSENAKKIYSDGGEDPVEKYWTEVLQEVYTIQEIKVI